MHVWALTLCLSAGWAVLILMSAADASDRVLLLHSTVRGSVV